MGDWKICRKEKAGDAYSGPKSSLNRCIGKLLLPSCCRIVEVIVEGIVEVIVEVIVGVIVEIIVEVTVEVIVGVIVGALSLVNLLN